ncbi:Acyl-CoA synthetase (AMP-forming)/AMP-acid ligase II [Succinivibrio dextrinosolvens DSM 3072]|uniref:Acyl-CoA synthetase (AMP-forming)/AMP-acid ligase II n=1 Tax=Succinivibrio dextrinosolvens DSM 3072 TaxID=1123324 RepID=A0A1T4V6W8_9GAMM|nr:class I adenylate-forming enzyme family protein [Succinivibrio dextrinosolvens]SKA60664.1 Acyl-CoA synthetase (AMP-forming)/AMP-acid ligase II [Succinivibrio dextrinosolvens DSM 3072]
MKRNELSLHEALFGNYDKHKIVAYSKNKSFTHKDFTDSIKALGLWLFQDNSVKNIAICIENAYSFSIAFIAAMYARKTPVLLGNITAHTFDDIKEKADLVISDLNIEGIAVPSYDFSKLLNKAEEFYTEQKSLESETEPDNLFSSLDEKSPIIFYTSGTTGKSKRVNKSLKSMQIDITCSYELSDSLESIDNLKLISTVPPYHMYGLTYRIFMPILRHIPMTTYMIRFPEELENYTESVALITSPAFVKRLDTHIKAPDIRLCLSAGSPMPDDAALDFFRWSECPVTEIYGSTESNSMAHRDNRGDKPLFIPFSAVKFVKTEDGYKLDSLMSDGYDRIDDNLEFEGPYFRITGRKDKIVKIEENRVSLTQIEKLLKDNPLIKDAVALVITRNRRACIGAVCVLNNESIAQNINNQNDASFDRKSVVNALKEYLKGYLPAVAIPRYFRIVETIPVNHMGKRITPLLEELFNDKA